MSTGAGQGGAAPLLAVTNTERHLERIGDLLEQLLGQNAGPVIGKGIKVSEPATGAVPAHVDAGKRTSRKITKG